MYIHKCTGTAKCVCNIEFCRLYVEMLTNFKILCSSSSRNKIRSENDSLINSYLKYYSYTINCFIRKWINLLPRYLLWCLHGDHAAFVYSMLENKMLKKFFLECFFFPLMIKISVNASITTWSHDVASLFSV